MWPDPISEEIRAWEELRAELSRAAIGQPSPKPAPAVPTLGGLLGHQGDKRFEPSRDRANAPGSL